MIAKDYVKCKTLATAIASSSLTSHHKQISNRRHLDLGDLIHGTTMV